MKTERLYYSDSSLLEFEATIIDVSQDGDSYITVLDKTAFYPTSGGQQNDIGMLNKILVTDVVDGDAITHVSKSKIGSVGETVLGQINFVRRHKNKQQHSAQHILSQAFFRLCNFTTMSVHLGDTYGNIELDSKDIAEIQLQQAEYLSNQIISENRKVRAITAHSDSLEQYNLRKPPKRSGEIRLIQIDDFECSACGGTHVNSTAEIQLIKIISTEKIRGRIAVNFVCGSQAIDDYNIRFQVTCSIAQKLTCNVNDIETHFDKLVEQNKSYKKDISAFQKDLIPSIIDSLLQELETINDTSVIFTVENRFDKNIINQFALELAEKCNGIAVLLYNDKIILSCANSVSFNAGVIAKQISKTTNLKGGGNKNIAQLGGADMSDFNLYKSTIKEIIAQGNNEA